MADDWLFGSGVNRSSPDQAAPCHSVSSDLSTPCPKSTSSYVPLLPSPPPQPQAPCLSPKHVNQCQMCPRVQHIPASSPVGALTGQWPLIPSSIVVLSLANPVPASGKLSPLPGCRKFAPCLSVYPHSCHACTCFTQLTHLAGLL